MKISIGTYKFVKEEKFTKTEKIIAFVFGSLVLGFVVGGIAGVLSVALGLGGAAILVGRALPKYE